MNIEEGRFYKVTGEWYPYGSLKIGKYVGLSIHHPDELVFSFIYKDRVLCFNANRNEIIGKLTPEEEFAWIMER